MKFNKWTLGIVAVIATASIALITGCKSTSANLGVVTVQTDTNGILFIGGTRVDPAAAGVAVKFAAKYGAVALLKDQPNSRDYLSIAAGVIDAAIISQTYDPESLKTGLTAALTPGTSASTAATISSAISDGLELYSTLYGQAVAAKVANFSPYLAPSLQGLSDGIKQALAKVPAQ